MSKNIFGGGNANSLYIPMSEDEQEAIARMIEQGNLRVHIVDWGYVNKPRITFGDARLKVEMTICFNKPEKPQPVEFFDFELQTDLGEVIYKNRMSTLYDNKPISIHAGLELTMVWDIMIKALDPKFVRRWKPLVTGITSRRMDRDTGDLTLYGNMNLNPEQRKLIQKLAEGEQLARQIARDKLGKNLRRK